MAIRMRRRSSRRRGMRPRTRWLAITPFGYPGGVSAGTNISALTLNDASGPVVLNDFVGGTLLRVLLDLDAVITAGAIGSGNVINHAGVFVESTQSPTAAFWTANNPSGSFMERLHSMMEFNTYGVGNVPVVYFNQHFPSMHFDTRVRRRINENMVLYLSQTHFLAGGVTGVDYGGTGRVLIQLP